jgi:hypothetical protein
MAGFALHLVFAEREGLQNAGHFVIPLGEPCNSKTLTSGYFICSFKKRQKQAFTLKSANK